MRQKKHSAVFCLVIGLLGLILSACQTTEPSEKFPDLVLTGNTSITATCISRLYLCDQLVENGGIVTKGKIFDSVTIDVPRHEILKLTKIKLCSYRAVTANVVLQINDENGIVQIFSLNTPPITSSSFILGAQSISMENNAHAYPCTKKDSTMLIDVLSYIFF